MNEAATVAKGRMFYFLHADTLPPPDWLPRGFANGDVPACFRLSFGSDHPLLRFYGWCTRFDVDAFRFGDQSLWVSREDFVRVGGYPDFVLLEDNAMVRRLRALRGTFRILSATVVTSPRKYERYGMVRTQLVYFVLYAMYRAGAGQRLLGRAYRHLLD